ncbi:MAG: hypothetical protein ABIP95_12940 [Pelobium sp.]
MNSWINGFNITLRNGEGTGQAFAQGLFALRPAPVGDSCKNTGLSPRFSKGI